MVLSAANFDVEFSLSTSLISVCTEQFIYLAHNRNIKRQKKIRSKVPFAKGTCCGCEAGLWLRPGREGNSSSTELSSKQTVLARRNACVLPVMRLS